MKISNKVIRKPFRKTLSIKALVLKTADNIDLDFGDSIQDIAEIAVGCQVKVDGKPAEGNYLMPDGRTLIFDKGKLIEIKEPTIQALKAENRKLKQQLSDTISFIKTIEKDMVVFKKSIKSCLMPRKPFKQTQRKPSGKRIPFLK